MANHKLDELSFEPAIEGFGLFTSLSESRLCYELNRKLALKLVRQKKDFSRNYAHTVYTFPSFSYKDNQRNADWFLLKNKTLNSGPALSKPNLLFDRIEERVYWIKAKNKFDFIVWLESNDDLYSTLNWLRAEIKNFAFINAAHSLNKTLINQLVKNTIP
jgi:hypothetical protein